jgi:heat shock protein HslJ
MAFAGSLSALSLATLLAACAMPQHPDSSAPTSDPFNPAATQLLDNTRWELTTWKNADGTSRAVPQATASHADGSDGGQLTLDFSTATGQRRVSGFSGCNRFTGSYMLRRGELTFGPLATTRRACPSPAENLESAYLGALAHIAKTGVQMRPPQQLQVTLEDGATLIFAQRNEP